MEMTRPGGNRGNSQPEGRPSPGAWKPAQNAGSHISTATTAAGLLSGKKSNPAKIVGSVRFLHRTAKNNRSKSVWTLFQLKHLNNQTVWPVIFGLTGPICARTLKSLHLLELRSRGHHDWPVKLVICPRSRMKNDQTLELRFQRFLDAEEFVLRRE